MVDRHVVLADPPALTSWDFGGCAYGLEPLTLPVPTTPDIDVADEDLRSLRSVVNELLAEPRSGAAWTTSDAAASIEELSWFRWITGHQATFATWRILGRYVEAVRLGRVALAAVHEPMTWCVEAFNALMIYTASCPPDVYTRLIRPSMHLQHRSFSGSWAPDYRPVRDLFRGRWTPWKDRTGDTRLADALADQNFIHAGIAERLVPGGKSLLSSAPPPVQRGLSLLSLIYDNYFLTLRAPTTRAEVLGQLFRRLVAINRDVARNGLYLDEPARGPELPADLRRPSVDRYRTGFAGVLAGAVAVFEDGAHPAAEPAARVRSRQSLAERRDWDLSCGSA